MPRSTSTALTISDPAEPRAMAPCTPHHIWRKARSRRTAARSAPELSSTNRHIAWTLAPLARRSSAAVRRSSMPPYRRAYAPISSADSVTARWRSAMTTPAVAAR